MMNLGPSYLPVGARVCDSQARGIARGLPRGTGRNGSVLIIVLWVAFGLVSIALYFAHSMSFELRASDNRVAALEADQAIEGAARYVTYLLANQETPGVMPDILAYPSVAVPIGPANYWFVGRDPDQAETETPYFGLVDEASKLNLNTATVAMLELLPRMTPELAAAIVDWRDANEDVTTNGAEAETYARLKPAYACKNAPFETVDELRLVAGADLEVLYGEDTNLNGILDPNENDGDASPPNDNRDGRLEPGILDFVTVYSREANTRTNGEPRINISTGQAQQQLRALLTEKFGDQRANQIVQRVSIGAIRSLIEFYVLSGMTTDEFAQVYGDLTTTTGEFVQGLVNVNTASAEVLACIPGIGIENAPSLVSFRQSNPDRLDSVAWVSEVLASPNAITAGRYLTAHSYQLTADVAALGHHGRGFRRHRFVFDTSTGTPRIIHRQDLTHLGWAIGQNAQQLTLLSGTQR